MSDTAEPAAPTLHARVREHFVEELARGALKPGDAIDRRETASQIGISVAPVHQAVSQLVSEGFLESRPRSGTRVRQLDARSTAGFLYVREGLETQAARLYAGAPMRRHGEALRAAGDRVDRLPPGVKHDQADVQFHRRLLQAANVPELVEAYDRIAMLTVLLSVSRLSELTSSERESHVSLIDRLGEAGPDEAARIISRHARSGKEAFFEMIDAGRAHAPAEKDPGEGESGPLPPNV